jgi:hypothetical protein
MMEMEVFNLVEIIEEDLKNLGFEWEIINLKDRPTVQIWKSEKSPAIKGALETKDIEYVLEAWLKRGAWVSHNKDKVFNAPAFLKLYKILKEIFGDMPLHD